MKVKKIVLGYTVLAAYRKCPQSFAYAYKEALRKAVPMSNFEKGSPLEFGQVLHKGLETYYSGSKTPVAYNDNGTALTAFASPAQTARETMNMLALSTSLTNTDSESPRSITHANELFEAYVARYPLENEPFTVLEVETERDMVLQPAAPDQPEIVWRAHTDALVELKTPYDMGGLSHSYAVLEHKTTSGNPADSLIERMLPNDQAVGYSVTAQLALGLQNPPPVYFNGLCSDRAALERYLDPAKHAAYVKRTKKEPFDPFLRHMVNVEQWMVDKWRQNALTDIRRMIEDIENDTYSQNAPDACTVFNSRCQFADLCKLAPIHRDNLKEFCYNKEAWKGFSLEAE